MSAKHEQLFLNYVRDLGEARTLAELWWTRLKTVEAGRSPGTAAVDAALARRWPVGPAAHPRIIAVLRSYWQACEELNQSPKTDDDDEGQVTPIDFLCEFLIDGRHDDLAIFISNLTYWPIEDAPGEEEHSEDLAEDTVLLPTDDRWRDRAAALIEAVRDVAPPQAARPSAGTAEHHDLFAVYRAELRKAKALESAYWNGLVGAAEADLGDHDLAVEEVRERRPAGPVGFPKVVAAIRAHWLRCVKLNEEFPAHQRVEPENLVLGWLISEGDKDLAAFLSELPFWPMGQDQAGNWV